LIETGEQQHVVDERAHAIGFFLDPAHRLGEVFGTVGRAPPEQLGVAADRGQWRAQLVRCVTDESPQPPFGRGARRERGFDLLHHLVQRETEPPDLGVRIGDVDALREVARRDRPGRLLHLAEGPQSELDHPPRQQGQREQDAQGDDDLDLQKMVQRVIDVVERDGNDHRRADE
jgi:hypothetical protein